jgi:hypothetical protein
MSELVLPFDPAKEREKRSAEVLKAAISSGRAAEMLDAITSGGRYAYNHINGELIIQPRTYLQERPWDAVRLTMSNTAAKTFAFAVLDPEGLTEDSREGARAIAEKVFLLAGREDVTEPVAHTLNGFEWDEIEDTMEAGDVAYVMLDRMADALQARDRLGLLYGAPHPL